MSTSLKSTSLKPTSLKPISIYRKSLRRPTSLKPIPPILTPLEPKHRSKATSLNEEDSGRLIEDAGA